MFRVVAKSPAYDKPKFKQAVELSDLKDDIEDFIGRLDGYEPANSIELFETGGKLGQNLHAIEAIKGSVNGWVHYAGSAAHPLMLTPEED